MALDPATRYAINVASGVVLLALGLAVARVQPRTITSRGLALFAGATGAAWGVNYGALLVPGALGGAALPAFGVLLLLASAGLVAVALRFPRPLEPRERALALTAAVLAALVAAATTVLRTESVLFLRTREVATATYVFAILLFALRFAAARDAAERSRDATSYGIMSGALVIYPGVIGGMYLHPEARGWGMPVLAALVLVAMIWLWSTRKADPASARTATSIALLALAIPLLALSSVRWQGGLDAASGGLTPAVARTLSALVLAYAILRHQLLGIDVKVRWGISKTTVAAVFIAVFFVASEGAQQFFGETLGSSYVGILAAGALVFAIAPLSRLADRVAERAVPVRSVAPPDDARRSRLEEDFRTALRLAWRDGRVTPDEDLSLARLARDLGLDPEAYMRLRHEAAEGARTSSRA